MKYIRRIAASVITVIFLASVIIGIGVIFAVRNVNVTLNSYKYPGWEAAASEDTKLEAEAELQGVKTAVLDKYQGKLIGFVNEDELKSCLDDSGFVLENLEKQFPCTLNITVSERKEAFRVAVGGEKYNIYDFYGKLLRTGVMAENSVNSLDGAPNIDLAHRSVDTIISADDIVRVAAAARLFGEKFGPVRPMIEKIVYDPERDGEFLEFIFRCGAGESDSRFVVRIADFDALAENKMTAAYQGFSKLTDGQKLVGTMSVLAVRGEISVLYYLPDGVNFIQLV